MTTIYKPSNVPNDPRALPQFLRNEFASIKRASEAGEPITRRRVLHAEPAKSQDGDEVEADGVNWNPGSGRGKYVKRNGAWAFVGDQTQTVINGGLTVTGGGITLSGGGSIKGGQTDYATGTGFFLGYSGATYKFSIGDASNYLRWDGSALTFSGALSAATGTFAGSLSAATGTFTGDITGAANIDITGSASFAGNTTGGDGNLYAVTTNSSGAASIGGLYARTGTNSAPAVYARSDGTNSAILAIAGSATVNGAIQANGGAGLGVYATSTTGTALSATSLSGGVALAVDGRMTMTDTTAVTNLNADMLDGNHASAFATASSVAKAMIYQTAGATAGALQGYITVQSTDGTIGPVKIPYYAV